MGKIERQYHTGFARNLQGAALFQYKTKSLPFCDRRMNFRRRGGQWAGGQPYFTGNTLIKTQEALNLRLNLPRTGKRKIKESDSYPECTSWTAKNGQNLMHKMQFAKNWN